MSARPITPDDVVAFVSLEDLQITPDGSLAAFVVASDYKEYRQQAQSRIWVVPTTGGSAQPFTSGIHADRAPRWSPDGAQLAFLSDRSADRTTQIYLLDRVGGEARQITNLPEAIREPAWSPDGTKLAFLMDDPEPEELRQRKERGDDVIEVEQHPRWRRVWTVDVASGATQQITTGDAQIWEFAWAPDGGFALISGPAPYEWSWFIATVAYVEPQGGVLQTIYTVPEKQFACPRVSPDGAQVAFLSCIWSDRGINGGDVLLMPVIGGAARNLSEGYNGSIWWIRWSPDGSALDYLAYEQGEAAIGRIDATTGARTTRWRGPCTFEEHFSAQHFADNGTFAVIRSDPMRPFDVWVAERTEDGGRRTEDGGPRTEDRGRRTDHGQRRTDHGQRTTDNGQRTTEDGQLTTWRQLTQFHPQAAEFALGETRTLCSRSSDGMEIQGLLLLPVGYREGARVPLITWVHGGPAWLYTQTYQGSERGLQILAGAGFAVFMPNPRGSAGWGVPFTEANIGDFGGRDFDDIMTGIDYVIGLGIGDPERLGIGGWSYGGFMSAWALTQTDRFKAAIVGAAITNWRSFHGTASIGTWDAISYRADPYEYGGRYDQFAPINYVNKATTPTLLIHGESDIIVPVTQSYEFFRALKDRGVPVEFVVYPREGHAIKERLHQLDRLKRYVEWFTRLL
jgi:dipeptidyl aminopeptidase/acylaminoacyl peptidase